MIFLICDSRKEFWLEILAPWGDVQIFPDGVALAYSLCDGGVCDLAVIAVDGADGMNYCTYVKHQRSSVPVLWVTEQKEFLNQSRRIGVEGFLVKPLSDGEAENAISRILGPPKNGRRGSQ